MAQLEKAILDGTFNRGPDPDAEPIRAASPTLSTGGRSDEHNEGQQQLQREELGPALLSPEEADARYSSLWSRQHTHSTGPKGVLADFRASSYDKQFPDALEKLNLEDSDVLDRDEQDQQAGAMAQDDGLEAWRRKRLEELRSSRVGAGNRTDEDAEGRFGHLREIGVSNFESAVLEEDPAVKVVLHVFEPHVPACLVLNLHLSNLARDYPDTKFLRAQASELDFATQDADVVLPTLLIYQGGELVSNLVAVDMEWERALDYDQEQVERVLHNHGVIARRSRSR